MSILMLKDMVEHKLKQPNEPTQSGKDILLEAHEFPPGNGLHVTKSNLDTVELGLVDPSKTHLIQDRAKSLFLLSQVYADSSRIKIPIVHKVGNHSITVQKAEGVDLLRITPREIMFFHEKHSSLDQKSFLRELLQGVDNLNQDGYIFGDYNLLSFWLDRSNDKLWVTDPGLSENSQGEHVNLSVEIASKIELFNILSSTSFPDLCDMFGVSRASLDTAKDKHKITPFKSVTDLIKTLDLSS